jgi:hypothetical protein
MAGLFWDIGEADLRPAVAAPLVSRTSLPGPCTGVLAREDHSR